MIRHLSLVRRCLVLLLFLSTVAAAQELKPVLLEKPKTSGGMPLMEALKNRRTNRAFSTKPLPLPVLSNLLWAAFGVNRPDGHRTAPSAMNWQEIDIYVAMKDGLFVYDAQAHTLQPVLPGDLRGLAGTQSFVKDAPVNLIYVANLSKTRRASGEDQLRYTAANTGFIAQNVYLFCASEGLATVVRGSVDRAALAAAMKLRPDQQIILAQTVGYPK